MSYDIKMWTSCRRCYEG